jgi:hypothetical protein
MSAAVAKTKDAKAPKNIRVFLRVRPPVAREYAANHSYDNLQLYNDEPKRVSLSKRNDKANQVRNFYFDRVWGQDSLQQDVYKEYALGAVDAAFDGQHGVLFVYGQTGSGKTFTISNDAPDKEGVLQQAMRDVWSRIATDTANDYSCAVTYVQLYNELLTDLLDANKGIVRLQMGSEGRGDVVMVSEETGLSIERRVASYQDTMQLFRLGVDRKEMTSTEMNLTSSRSHTIFTFYIHKSARTAVRARDAGATEANTLATIALEGRIVLCDLAGSERVSKTHAVGKTLDEAQHINSSLLVLGRVVAALTDKKSQHAPFRESKLTRLLQYSLLGNGNTSIVVNVSPSDDNTEETHMAILFGQRAIQIVQQSKRHEVLDYKALYLQLQADLDAKQDAVIMEAIREERAIFEEQINNLKEQLRYAEQENKALIKENQQLRRSGGPTAGTVDGGATTAAGVAAPPTSPASPASSGTDGKASAAVPSQWAAVEDLRASIAARDEKSRIAHEERMRLALLLADEKRTVFRLAEKLRAMVMQYSVERNLMTQRLTELQNEVAELRGTDYLSPNVPVEEEPQPVLSPRQAAGAPGAGSNGAKADAEDAGDAVDTMGMLQNQLNKAYNVIQRMQQERTELIIYQCKSQKAIRFLVAEHEQLLRRSGGISQSEK